MFYHIVNTLIMYFIYYELPILYFTESYVTYINVQNLNQIGNLSYKKV